jgi:protein-S-isoprenylcysteine O-methyltransferase Ste14
MLIQRTNALSSGLKTAVLLAITIFPALSLIPGCQLPGFSLGRYSHRVGFIISTIGIGFLTLAMTNLGLNWRLITSGIYSISRNPAYVGFDLSAIGLLITVTNAVTVLITPVTIVIFVLIIVSEQLCTKHFGTEYVRYMPQVPRYLLFL